MKNADALNGSDAPAEAVGTHMSEMDLGDAAHPRESMPTDPEPPRAAYPKRIRRFGEGFARRLINLSIAQEIGPDACLILLLVVTVERAGRFTGPARFWNRDLQQKLGFPSHQRFLDAREKAVTEGWLHYEAGTSGRPGEYWVLIPEWANFYQSDRIGQTYFARPVAKRANAVPQAEGIE